MAYSFAKGSFAKKTDGTGLQAVTGAGFTPKALILFATYQSAEGFGAHYVASIGFCNGTVNRCQACAYEDNVVTSNTWNRRSNTKVIVLLNENTGALRAQADIDSLDSDGFTLDWTTNDAVAVIIHYVALGGDDLTNVNIGTFQIGTDTGNLAVTGVGFQPDFVMFMGSQGTNIDISDAGGGIQVGFAISTSKRGAFSHDSVDAVNPSDTNRWQMTNRCIIKLRGNFGGGQQSGIADFVSFDSDGFTINRLTGWGFDGAIWYMALAGGEYDVGSLTQPTSTGNQTTTLAIRPRGVLLMSVQAVASASLAANNKLSFGGGSSGTSRGCIAAGDDAAVSPTQADMDTETDRIIVMNSQQVVDADADLDSLGAGSFTLNWTTADATEREVIFVAFGEPLQPAGFLDGLVVLS